MTDVAVADKDKFCGGRGKGLVPFRTFDAAFRARCVNRDLSHVLDDTDPNYRPQRTADVMMDGPEGVIDPASSRQRTRIWGRRAPQQHGRFECDGRRSARNGSSVATLVGYGTGRDAS